MKRKIILYLVIIIFVAAVVFLGYRLLNSINKGIQDSKNRFNEIEEKATKQQEEIFDEVEKQQEAIFDEVEKQQEKYDINSFNNHYELYAGRNMGSIIESKTSDLITNNKTNPTHLIEFIFDGVSYGTDLEAIRNKKNEIGTFNYYDLSFEYGEDGYINKFIIYTLE